MLATGCRRDGAADHEATACSDNFAMIVDEELRVEFKQTARRVAISLKGWCKRRKMQQRKPL